MNRGLLASIVITVNIALTYTCYADTVDDCTNKIVSIDSDIKQFQEDIKLLDDGLIKITERLEKSQLAVDKSNKDIKNLQDKLTSTMSNIQMTESVIKQTQDVINENKKDFKEKSKMLGQRFRCMYENNIQHTALYLLFSSKNLSDLLEKYFSFKKVVDLDNNLISKVNENINLLKEKQESLTRDKEKLNSILCFQKQISKNLEIENNKLKTEMEINTRAFTELKLMEDNKKKKIEELNNDKSNVESKIKMIESQEQSVELFGPKGSINNSSNSSAKGFPFPVNGSITCPFGGRISPITHKYNYHHGVDLGVGTGTPVHCSKDGIVEKACYNTVYGNMVLVKHGGGYQTLYAHNSKLLIKVGDIVKQGQVIAKSGSTGWSTGPHCHFEVRLNGTCISPY